MKGISVSQLPNSNIPPTSPAISPGASKKGQGHSGKSIDLLKLAKAQRALLWCVLGQIGLMALLMSLGAWPQAYAHFGGAFVALLWVAVSITSVVMVVRVALAYGYHPALAVLGALATVVGCIGLLILLLLNQRINTTLKAAGCKIGLLGVSPQEMNKLREGVCSSCGYSLLGVPGGQCPECGWRRLA